MDSVYYEKLLEQHGDSPRSLDWSEAGQKERFRVLCDVGIGPETSVLDVGCGIGHFYRYLEERFPGFAAQYVGVDASQKSVEFARSLFPTASFEVGDALRGPLPRAEIVVSSGVVNVICEDNLCAAYQLLWQCYSACTVSCAVNFLSAQTKGIRRTDRFYFDPKWVLGEAMMLSDRVTLRHDYRTNDFTVYIWR